MHACVCWLHSMHGWTKRGEWQAGFLFSHLLYAVSHLTAFLFQTPLRFSCRMTILQYSDCIFLIGLILRIWWDSCPCRFWIKFIIETWFVLYQWHILSEKNFHVLFLYFSDHPWFVWFIAAEEALQSGDDHRTPKVSWFHNKSCIFLRPFDWIHRPESSEGAMRYQHSPQGLCLQIAQMTEVWRTDR